jgi:hypothetical protein
VSVFFILSVCIFATRTVSPVLVYTSTLVQIFVEVERARLIRIMSRMKEAEGDINEAANLLQEVQVCIRSYVRFRTDCTKRKEQLAGFEYAQSFHLKSRILQMYRMMVSRQVETFGAMDRKEKAEYILDQMRCAINEWTEEGFVVVVDLF